MLNKDSVVYIIGSLTPRSSQQNHALEYIDNVREFLRNQEELMRLGVGVINPALDLFVLLYMKQSVSEESVRENGLKLLRKADAVLLTNNWWVSSGSFNELKQALILGLKIYKSLEDLKSDLGE